MVSHAYFPFCSGCDARHLRARALGLRRESPNPSYPLSSNACATGADVCCRSRPGHGADGRSGIPAICIRRYPATAGPWLSARRRRTGREHDRYVSDPFGYDPYFGPSSHFFYPRFGYGRWGSPFYYGWGDPFWYGGGYGRGIDSYVEYHSEADLHIRAAGTNQPLFDGRAQARSQTNRLDVLVPNLVEALFTGFPGRNGEVVKITVPAKKPAGTY
jgi:hypothetical protein